MRTLKSPNTVDPCSHQHTIASTKDGGGERTARAARDILARQVDDQAHTRFVVMEMHGRRQTPLQPVGERDGQDVCVCVHSVRYYTPPSRWAPERRGTSKAARINGQGVPA